ncbi:MAG TPA: quinone oxidoreductase [Acidobacteriota bacterium]|nr:quinone oxidoreductase [Acidobacteriota bacterium]
MKAIRVEQLGGPEVLQLREVPDPQPSKGQALIRLEDIGVNFIDVYHRTGLYPLPLPFIPGGEGAGIVEAVGPEVTEVKVGDRVAYAMGQASYAEKVVMPAWKLVRLPEWLSTQDAAAVMLQGLTAHYLLRSTYEVKKGDPILIHAAAGGVGLLMCQIAKQIGAFTIGTVSTEEKAQKAKEAGANEVILYTKFDFLEDTKKIMRGGGVVVVYDSVGKTTYEKSLECLRPRGMLVLFGQSSGAVPPFNPALLAQKGSLFLTRPSLAHYMLTREELMQRTNELFDWIRSGAVKIHIDSTFKLAQASDAHRKLESRASSGKILLVP